MINKVRFTPMAKDSTCPECGTHDVRLAHARGAGERLWNWSACIPCAASAARRDFGAASGTYRRYGTLAVPRCYRTELSTWSEQYYNPPFGVNSQAAIRGDSLSM